MTEVPTRLLRNALGRTDETSPDCVDAGTLAAWTDDSLTREERAAVENHASGCARCQALLAAMVRTDAEARHISPSTESRLRNLFGLRWLVPIAAAAVVVAVWIAVPARKERPVASPPAAVQPAPESSQPFAAAPSSAPPASTATRDQPRQRERRAELPAPKPAAPPTSAEAVADSAAAPPPPPPLASPAAAPAPPPPAATSELAQPQARRSTALAAAQGFAGSVASPTIAIVSADAAARWRIVTPGSVDRSTDGGATWESQATGVAVTLSAGVAPSRDICWMVGPRGTIVLSTDGHLWRRLPFPETIDLVAVRASDGAHATVTARDGRLFVTRDGGATWQSP